LRDRLVRTGQRQADVRFFSEIAFRVNHLRSKTIRSVQPFNRLRLSSDGSLVTFDP